MRILSNQSGGDRISPGLKIDEMVQCWDRKALIAVEPKVKYTVCQCLVYVFAYTIAPTKVSFCEQITDYPAFSNHTLLLCLRYSQRLGEVTLTRRCLKDQVWLTG